MVLASPCGKLIQQGAERDAKKAARAEDEVRARQRDINLREAHKNLEERKAAERDAAAHPYRQDVPATFMPYGAARDVS